MVMTQAHCTWKTFSSTIQISEITFKQPSRAVVRYRYTYVPVLWILILLFCIRIQNLHGKEIADPNLDLRALKLTKINKKTWFAAFLEGTLFKYIIQLFVTLTSDQDADPDPDSHGSALVWLP
jgi:hypothetical protein